MPGARPHRLAGSLVAAAALALAAAACGGGGGRLSKEEYIKAADTICEHAGVEIADLGEPSPGRLGDYIDEAAKIARDQLAKLRALDPPAGDGARLEQAYALLERQTELAVAGTKALERGDRAAHEKASAELATVTRQLDRIAKGYGLATCGRS